MSKVLLETNIVREKGKLYFCATNKNGNITVCEAIMARGGKKSKNRK